MHITGSARVVGDDVNTDYIISSRRKRDAAEISKAVPYIFEDLSPPLASPIAPGDIIVAGENFGCGSAMEIAVEILLAARVQAVVAKSFARTYYRNAVNAGLLVIEADTSAARGGGVLAVHEGDTLEIDLDPTAAGVQVLNLTTGQAAKANPPSEFAMRLIQYDGLISYLHRKGGIPLGRL